MAAGRTTSASGGGLGEEHLLHDDEGVLEGGGVDAVACDWIRADDVERGELTATGGVEDLEQIEARRRWRRCTLGEGAGGCDGRVAGEHVGEQAHVGCAAGVDVVGEQSELRAGDGEAEVDELLEVCAAELGADEDEELLFGFDGIAEGGDGVGVCGYAGGGVRRRLRGSWPARCSRRAARCRKAFGLAAELDLGASWRRRAARG